jgi:hypothetical protein
VFAWLPESGGSFNEERRTRLSKTGISQCCYFQLGGYLRLDALQFTKLMKLIHKFS